MNNQNSRNPIREFVEKNMKVVVVLAIVGSLLGASMVSNSNNQKEYEELNPVKDFSAYTSQQYITNPKYLKNQSNFVVDSSGAIAGHDISGHPRFPSYRDVWVERVLYFDKEEVQPHLLVSYTYAMAGENVISFYLQPFQFGTMLGSPYPLRPRDKGVNEKCSLNLFRDALDRTFTNKYVLLESADNLRLRVRLASMDGDVIIKKQDVDSALLKGVSVEKCSYSSDYNYCISQQGGTACIPSLATACFADKSEMISGRELLLINGYVGEAYSDSLESIAELAHKGVWGACSN